KGITEVFAAHAAPIKGGDASNEACQLPRGQRLVKAGGVTEHITHGLQPTYIPTIQRLVEAGCSVKHKTHPGHVADVPVVQGLIESSHVLKQVTHVQYRADIPIVDIGYYIYSAVAERKA